jgi:hypothetical protein
LCERIRKRLGCVRVSLAISAIAFSFAVGACSEKPAEPVSQPIEASSEQVFTAPPVTGAPSAIGCSTLLRDYRPFESVKLDYQSAQKSFAASVDNPEVIVEPIDIDNDGDLEIVVVGDRRATGRYVEMPRSELLLGLYTMGDDPTNVRQATDRAKTIGLRSPLVKAIGFSQIYNFQTIRGKLAESLPMLQYARIEIGGVTGDPLIRATVTGYHPVDSATGQVSGPPPRWDMLLKMAPDWSSEALCADPLPAEQK